MKQALSSDDIRDMPTGFYGKVSLRVEGERQTWFIQSLVEATRNLPIVKVELTTLDDYLDENAWFHGTHQPTIRSLIEHYRRAENADLNCPIIISTEFGVMDGLHRIVKAHLNGHTSINAVFIETLPEPDYIGDF
ncbi:hypothetical protein CS022_13055 [Veronia nyctiphanis]|uniref:Chromosome partitioning protein ParB n=1 Tax=Veronia nyctiphanis TaxID=1278244 RepID=A0A4Q0YUG2_9GAMM|nr:hypothetical protein [Veronia nyctiphanis]RXJ72789.1 hypothetical protein CS022_13055 [Veronia nyctiphanis]